MIFRLFLALFFPPYNVYAKGGVTLGLLCLALLIVGTALHAPWVVGICMLWSAYAGFTRKNEDSALGDLKDEPSERPTDKDANIKGAKKKESKEPKVVVVKAPTVYSPPVITLSDPNKYAVVKVKHIGLGKFEVGIAERRVDSNGNVQLTGIQYIFKPSKGITQSLSGKDLKVFYHWS